MRHLGVIALLVVVISVCAVRIPHAPAAMPGMSAAEVIFSSAANAQSWSAIPEPESPADSFQPAAEVQVIELRRRERRHQEHADEGGRESPEWHVQWLVSGHWRRHWYPRAKAHKPRYIAPYVKGPQDKPLKPPRSQLFLVKR